MKWPNIRDLQDATFDGAVYQLTDAADDAINLSWKLSNCASGSRYPRLHRLLSRTIKLIGLLLFNMRRAPRNHPGVHQ